MAKKNAVIMVDGKFYAGGAFAPWTEEYPAAIKYSSRTAIHVASTHPAIRNMDSVVVENHGMEDERRIQVPKSGSEDV